MRDVRAVVGDRALDARARPDPDRAARGRADGRRARTGSRRRRQHRDRVGLGEAGHVAEVAVLAEREVGVAGADQLGARRAAASRPSPMASRMRARRPERRLRSSEESCISISSNTERRRVPRPRTGGVAPLREHLLEGLHLDAVEDALGDVRVARHERPDVGERVRLDDDQAARPVEERAGQLDAAGLGERAQVLEVRGTDRRAASARPSGASWPMMTKSMRDPPCASRGRPLAYLADGR